MATFQRISLDEARQLVMAPRRLAQAEYREYIRQLDENTAGRMELADGDRPITIRARLKAAAKAEGKEVDIQRRGSAMIFMLKGNAAGG
jgi:hypothetical protein